jgi:hypothetical protein
LPRCQDGRSFAEAADPSGAWPLDPDTLDDILDAIFVPGAHDQSFASDRHRHTARSRRVFCCLWPLHVSIDPEEQEQDRRRMFSYMARYGRQSLLDRDWQDEDLEEFKAKYHDLAEVIRLESQVGRKEEDHG